MAQPKDYQDNFWTTEVMCRGGQREAGTEAEPEARVGRQEERIYRWPCRACPAACLSSLGVFGCLFFFLLPSLLTRTSVSSTIWSQVVQVPGLVQPGQYLQAGRRGQAMACLRADEGGVGGVGSSHPQALPGLPGPQARSWPGCAGMPALGPRLQILSSPRRTPMAHAPKVAESRAQPWSHGFPLRAARTTRQPARPPGYNAASTSCCCDGRSAAVQHTVLWDVDTDAPGNSIITLFSSW